MLHACNNCSELQVDQKLRKKFSSSPRSDSQATRVSPSPAPPPLVFPISGGLWVMEMQRTPLPPRRPWRRDPTPVLVWFSVSVGLCGGGDVHSRNNVSYARSPSRWNLCVVGGRVDVCPQISLDSVGAGLRWICYGLVFVHLQSRVYRFDPSKIHFPLSEGNMT